MAKNDGIRKYLEAGAVLGHVTRARAEEIVNELVNAGDVQRDQAQTWVDDLLEWSRRTGEELVHLVRDEVHRQLETLGVDPQDLGRQAGDMVRRSAQAGRAATATAAERAGQTASAARQAGKKATGRSTPWGATRAPAKKATAKKSPAKKATTKKATAKKATAKKSPAKKATTKKATTKKATTKKATTKKAPAKEATS